jgi:hypothetical protein
MAAHTHRQHAENNTRRNYKSSVVAPELTSPDLDPTLLFRSCRLWIRILQYALNQDNQIFSKFYSVPG